MLSTLANVLIALWRMELQNGQTVTLTEIYSFIVLQIKAEYTSVANMRECLDRLVKDGSYTGATQRIDITKVGTDEYMVSWGTMQDVESAIKRVYGVKGLELLINRCLHLYRNVSLGDMADLVYTLEFLTMSQKDKFINGIITSAAEGVHSVNYEV